MSQSAKSGPGSQIGAVSCCKREGVPSLCSLLFIVKGLCLIIHALNLHIEANESIEFHINYLIDTYADLSLRNGGCLA